MIDVSLWQAIKHCVSVVEPCTNHSTGDHVGVFVGDGWSIMSLRWWKHVRLTSFMCLSFERLLSCVTPFSLKWSSRETIEPTTLIVVITSDKEWERCRVLKIQNCICRDRGTASYGSPMRAGLWDSLRDSWFDSENRIGKEKCKVVSHQHIAAGGLIKRRSNGGSIDTESKRTENGILGNTDDASCHGMMCRCRRVITSDDRLRVASKIR